MSRRSLALALILLLMSAFAFGQSVSSSVKGVVTDPTGAVLSGATLTLTNQATATAFTAKSDETGSFTFLNVLPGKYSLKAEAAGFTIKTTKDLVVEANQIRTIGAIKLDIGGTTTEVSVTAEAAAIQLASAEKAGSVTGSQLENLAIKGRDIFALLTTVPGVVDNGTAPRDINRPTQLQGTMINGGRDSSKNFTVDGVTDMDTGSNQTVHFTPSPDSVQEVRILTSNYQAEFGRNSSGTINVITKSGNSAFHGTAFDYYRHESLNANSWDNNRANIKKQPYRLRNTGFTLGGPVYVPGKLNTKKDKVFFFWSEEFAAVKQSFSKSVTTPTALERQGDFSQSFDSAGQKLYVKDPRKAGACNATTQVGCFDNMQVPEEMWSAEGLKLLNYFPLPNYTDPRGAWYSNYLTTYSGNYDRRSDMIRVDMNLTPTLSAYYRMNRDSDKQEAPWGFWLSSMNWMPSPMKYDQPGYGHAVHLTKIFSPTLVNEFNFGISHNMLNSNFLDPSKWQRSNMGIGELFADAPYIPNVTFGKRASAIGVSYTGQYPYINYNDLYSFSDTISKTYKNHNLRAGVYFERNGKDSPVWNTYRGAISFSPSSWYSAANSYANPLDTGDGFANALTGTFSSYSESSKWLNGDWWFTNWEWFVQDNWRVTPKLTLDYGMRFYHMSPVTDYNNTMASFDPSAYDPAKAPRMYVPRKDANGIRVGYDAVTDTWVPASMIGLFVPGTGDPNNGGIAAGTNGTLGNGPAIDFGPRFGFAYDVLGNGKTALRGGFGVFKDRGSILPWVYAAGGPPVAYSASVYYSTLSDLPSAAGYRGPSGGDWAPGGSAFFGDYKTPTTMNYSLGVQQQLPSNIVLDVAYVGSQSRHLWVNHYLNALPIGAQFNPANVDTTTGTALPAAFLRPYLGWGDVHAQEFTGTSNYNSLQVAANRRFTKGLQFGVAYTWAKALGVQSDENGLLGAGAVSSYLPWRDWNYGPLNQDRAHTLVINYFYDLPNLGKKYEVKPLGWITDNWSISGISTFQTGAPVTPYLYWSAGYNVTGSSEGARGQLIGDPLKDVPKGMNFNPAAFAATPVGTYGNVTFGNFRPGILRGPGINNWDMTLSKRIPLGSEQRYLQFRAEMFNIFNHTQYATYNANVAFDNNNQPIISKDAQGMPLTGAYNAARAPRMMQLSLKLFF